MASYCDARQRNGIWQLRIDDIDGPRSVPKSADAIQRSLDIYGFEWDGPIVWQSKRQDLYQHALHTLVESGLIFACQCSRRQLPAGTIYPGTCRTAKLSPTSPSTQYAIKDHALRCRMLSTVCLNDAVQGNHRIDLAQTKGDTIVWRRDGLVSYALACAVDDSDRVTHVVRGADLMDSTGVQIGILKALGRPAPDYAHIPVAIDTQGDKLSKHSKSESVATLATLPTLLRAWKFLGQAELEPESVAEFWHQSTIQWQMQRVPVAKRLQQ